MIPNLLEETKIIYSKTWVFNNPNINEIDDIIKPCYRDVVDEYLFGGILYFIYDVEENGCRVTRTGLLKKLNDNEVVIHILTIEFFVSYLKILITDYVNDNDINVIVVVNNTISNS